jgi:hypothetical protein
VQNGICPEADLTDGAPSQVVSTSVATDDARCHNSRPSVCALDQVVAHPSGSIGSGITPDRRTLQVAEIAAREALSPVERLELVLQAPI